MKQCDSRITILTNSIMENEPKKQYTIKGKVVGTYKSKDIDIDISLSDEELDGIKALNTGGTWSGNVYTINSITFAIQTDTDGNVIGINASGTPSNRTQLTTYSGTLKAGSYTFNGCPSGGSGTTYQMFVNANVSYMAMLSHLLSPAGHMCPRVHPLCR